MPGAEADEFACLAKPLPPEPFRRVRRGATSAYWPRWLASRGLVLGTTAGVALVTFGISHVAAALFTVVFGIDFAIGWTLDARRRRAANALKAAHRHEPWLWDHAWDPAGASASAVTVWKRAFPLRTGCAVVYGSIFACAIIGAAAQWRFAVLWVAFVPVAWCAWMVWRTARAGVARLSFAEFPFHPGEPVTLYFGMSEGGATFERAAFHLRRIEESTLGPRGGPLGLTATFERRIHRPPGLLPGPNQDVELVFDVPASAGGTALSAPLPVYWVLDVVANTSAGPYRESFLVPIYDRPAA